MLIPVRKAKVSLDLFLADKPKLRTAFYLSSLGLFLTASLGVYRQFDGVQLVDISGVKVEVSCPGFCTDKK